MSFTHITQQENDMVQAAWGVKRTCQSCNVKFYDFKKNPIVCPACSAEFNIEAVSKPKRGRPSHEEVLAKKSQAMPVRDDTELDDVVILDDDELVGDFDDDAVIDDDESMEDANDLGGDDLDGDVDR
jgi:uncharacterized protein (TIGR02300 family)